MNKFARTAAFATAAAIALAAGAASAAEIFYIQGFSNNFYKFDTATSTETLIGTVGLNADSTGMAFSPGGTLYAYERLSKSLYTINPGTGATALVGVSGIDAEDFTVNLAGTLGYISSGGLLYGVNLATGTATSIGAIGQTFDGLTTAPVAVTIGTTNYAAGTLFAVDSHNLFAVNASTLSVASLGNTIGADETLDFGSDGTLYGHGDDGKFYTIKFNPLASTQIGTTTAGLVFGMAVRPGAVVAAVPEPGTWTMMIAGFGIAGFAMRSRRRRSLAIV